MKIFQLQNDIDISVKEMQSNSSDLLHKHHYFELIYIMEGSGIHNINGNHYEFKKGETFLLTPEDAHTFIISSPVKSCIIDFTQNFFRGRGGSETVGENGELFKRLEYVFHNHNRIKGNLLQGDNMGFIEILISQLLKEKEKPSLITESIIKNIVFLLLQFITRNIQAITISGVKVDTGGSVYHIINYIQQYIYNKDVLKLDVMALHFKKSPDHLTRIFKKETGKTIKDYIIDYKIDLIKTRLKFSMLNVSEIAYELNFTDESHLNKLFKKKFGVSVNEFKKSLVNISQ